MHDIASTGIVFFFIALLYSTVGHAGASGYLATMALLSFPAGVMKPTALALNILVALVTSVRFYQAGYFSWRLFWPFALASVPLAYLGGSLSIHTVLYKALVGVALLFAAAHLVVRSKEPDQNGIVLPKMTAALATGGIIGFISGLTGVGGGIFLSPVLIMLKWAGLRETSAAAAVFILVNSISGLAGFMRAGGSLPDHLTWWSAAVIAGGFIGSSLGATKLNNSVLRVLLGAVLFMAGMKLVMI